MDITNEITIGASSCILGERVRWNGGHCQSKKMVHRFKYVSICPEVGIGLDVPREALVLDIEDLGNVRLISKRTRIDYTEPMYKYSEKMVQNLHEQNISGFILKGKSPSCGLQVNVKGISKQKGIFAKILTENWPTLPVIEDGMLHDPVLLNNLRFYEHYT